MDESRPTPEMHPVDPTPTKRDTSGVVGWILLIALAIGVLALRFFGGGGC